MNRVVVTGIGAVSPIANSFKESWNAAKSGVSGIMPITKLDATGMKWKMAGELKKYDAEQYLSKKEIIRLDPFIHYAVSAALMAAEDAGLLGRKLQYADYLASAGVIVGSSRGGISTIERELLKKYTCRRGQRFRLSAFLMPATTISMASAYIAQKLGIKGYCLAISNACASGANSIGEAYKLIKAGFSNPVFCGGTEAPLCRVCIEGYGESGALSRISGSSASRPFDKNRDGFVLSEGACILVLEEYRKALKRDARIYGEIKGYGNTADSYHQTIPSSEGEARAIKAAMDEAGFKLDDIGFISAHGTSTPLGDRVETEAIKRYFGNKAYDIHVTSIKSMTGHMLAASGAFEAAIALMSIKEGVIPPTINLKKRDPDCDLDYVTYTKNVNIDFCLSHSFGFGGVNAVLAFKKFYA